MLAYNEIKEKKIIIYNDEPCEVIESHVARTQQRKPQNQVKLKSLITGKTFSATFHVSDKAEEADISKREIKFLYHSRGEYWFCEPNDPSKRFKLEESLFGNAVKFLKANMLITAMVWGEDAVSPEALAKGEREKIIKAILPIKVIFEVKEAPPAVKGDTAKGGTKQVTLENGTIISAPLFINQGDKIMINTETGEYSERA